MPRLLRRSTMAIGKRRTMAYFLNFNFIIYRLIDTATIYENEADIGNALEKYFKTGKVKREDVFVVTKVCA